MAMTRSQQFVIIGAVLVAGGIAAAVAWDFSQRTTIKITFRQTPNGDCIILKQDAQTKKDKKVRWEIDYECGGEAPQVSVGNFRSTAESKAKGCQEATEGEVAWPFRDTEKELSSRRHTSRIELKVKKREDLPGFRDYFYDICTGADGERKWDPRLVIEE